MKKLGLGILIVVVALSISGITLAKTDPGAKHGKPDLHKPVQATGVELVKKATLRGKPSGEKRPATQATTGILGTQVTGNRYAIVIGIADYPGTDYDLKYTDDDAREMIKTLTDVYGFNPANIHSFIDEEGQGAVNATRANILSAIQDIEKVAIPGDEVVFFFSGHGMKGRANDGDKEAIDESIVVHDSSNLVPIWDGELKSAFDGFKTSRIIFVFDSCLAGGMTDLAAPGRIINMATTETGTAYEFDSLQNGQFTYYFVDQGMLQGLADTHDYIGIDGNEPTTIEEAFDYSKTECSYQTPTISDKFFSDLLL